MLERWRQRFPENSIFRKPLVFEITLVLVIKILLLIALWQFAFKPLKPNAPTNIEHQLLPLTPSTSLTQEQKP